MIPDPVVTISPLSQILCQNATIADICVVANGGIGTYQYQWWENINTGGWVLATTGTGANTDCYTPQNTTVNTTEYYCVITQLGGQGCEVISNTAIVEIVPGPNFIIQPLDSSVCVDALLTINIDYYSDITAGATFQWYENSSCDPTDLTTPSTGIGNNTNTLTPLTTSPGTTYYYCTVQLPSGGCDIIISNCAEIIVNPDPTIDIQPLEYDTICEGGTIATPLTVSYTIGTGVGQVTYQWYEGIVGLGTPVTTGTGATTNTYMPVTTGLASGTYLYYAIISFDGNNCQDAISNSAQIVIIGDPIANFDLWSGLDTDTLCVNHIQSPVWINTSSGVNISSYTWEIIGSNGYGFGPTTISSDAAPTFPYLTAGTQSNGYVEYELILSVENACSTPTDTHTIVITPLPNPEFTTLLGPFPTNIICLGSPITLSVGNSTINPPFTAATNYNDSIKIDMGDGTFYYLASNCGLNGGNLTCFESIQHPYANTGTYQICVTAYNECDSAWTCDSIEVINTNITSSVNVDTPYGCINQPIYFTDNSSYTAPYQTEIHWWWNVDPNNITNYLLPNGGGTSADQVVWQDTITPGYQVSHSYSTPGIKFVLQQMSTGPIPPCMYEHDSTLIDSIIIYPEPIAHFINPANNEACLGDSVNILFDSEIPIIVGIPQGEQMITNVIWKVIAPSSDTYTYTLANGGISNLSDDIQIIVDEYGTWTIEITVESNKGCSKIWSDSIIVYDLPKPMFTVDPDSTCPGGGNTLFNAWPTTHIPTGPSVETDNPIEYWNWNFDNPGSIGNILTGEIVGDAIHSFNSSGYYNVTLSVSDNKGCEAQIVDTVFISTPIRARAFADTVCFNTPTLLNGSISTLGTTDWFWDLDMNGTIDATGNIILHTFTSAGLHTVRLTTESNSIADSVICTDDTVITILVRELPQVIFVADTICYSTDYPKSINLTNNSLEGDTVINNWQWSFGDNQFSGDSSVSHVYDTCGVYEIILTAIDEYSCENKDTSDILVVCPPVASFVIDTMCFDIPTVFTNSSNEGTYNITLYEWLNLGAGNYFPNTTPGNLPFMNFEFDNAGVQDETILIVVDEFGCRDTTNGYAYVRTNPIANFITIDTNFCAGTAFQFFNATAIPPSASIDSIDWTFQTGITSNSTNTITEEDPIVTFNAPGNYYVELYFEDDKGCYDDTIKWIEIDNLPYVDFVAQETCAKDTAYFWNYSLATTNPLNQYSWLWDLGYTTRTDSNTYYDFAELFLNQPNNIYEGVYQNVSLTVTDIKGCKNTFTDIVKLHPLPKVELYIDTSICRGDCIELENQSSLNIDPSLWSESPYNIEWSFNGNLISTQNPIYDFCNYSDNLQAGVAHEVLLEVWTTWGCSNNRTEELYLWEVPKNDYEIYYPEGQCSDSSTAIPFEYITAPGYPLFADSWEYTISDLENNIIIGNPIIFNNVYFDSILPHPGVFTMEIHLENDKCIFDTTIQLISFPKPEANFTPIDTTICEDKEVFIEFTDISTIPNDSLFNSHSEQESEISIRRWLLGISPISYYGTEVNESYDVINGEYIEYPIQLIVISNSGCSDTAIGKVRVNPAPIADFITPTQEEGNYGTYLLNGKRDKYGYLITTTSNGNYADPSSFNYEWLISDGPFDTVNIFNAYSNNKPYLPSVDSLYYQFQYFLYGEYDSTNICLIVSNKIDLSENISKSCPDTICKKIKIEAWGKLFVPNALYPESGDYGSSLFLPKGKSLIEYNLQVFDKFGNLLWENDEINIEDGSPKTGWDGTSEGVVLSQGTYVWKIAARFINGPWNGIGSENKKSGTVYLIR